MDTEGNTDNPSNQLPWTDDLGTTGADRPIPSNFRRAQLDESRRKEIKRVRIISIVVCLMGVALVLLVVLHIIFTNHINYVPLTFCSAGMIILCSGVLIYCCSAENGLDVLAKHKGSSYALLGGCCILSFATGIVSGFNAFQNGTGTTVVINIFICFFNLMSTWAIYAAGYSIYHRPEPGRPSRYVPTPALPSLPSYSSYLSSSCAAPQANVPPFYIVESAVTKLPDYDEAMKMKE